jgi:AcrR family transcriptional regulator
VRKEWLELGYKNFAQNGPENLSISQIGKEIGASRSSFYHHFGDLSFFIEELLAAHWEVCQEFDRTAQKNCKNLLPDLYLELAKHPVSLGFHIQLFQHRSNPRFNYLFLKSYASSAQTFGLNLFADYLQWKSDKEALYHLWLTLGEAWYSRLNPNDLAASTLQLQAEEVLKGIALFVDSGLFRRLENKIKP